MLWSRNPWHWKLDFRNSCAYLSSCDNESDETYCLSINLIFNSVAFWIDTGGSTSIPYAISNLIQYARYPITIYPLVMQIILCFVVPCAFMGMIPAMIITGKVSVIYALAVIMIAALFMRLAILVFNKGITKYESAGM